jgi:hypothetical protein
LGKATDNVLRDVDGVSEFVVWFPEAEAVLAQGRADNRGKCEPASWCYKSPKTVSIMGKFYAK